MIVIRVNRLNPTAGLGRTKIKRNGVNVRNLPPRFYERGYMVRDLKDAASFARKIPFLKSHFSKGGVNFGTKNEAGSNC